jgi:hypothetical protein
MLIGGAVTNAEIRNPFPSKSFAQPPRMCVNTESWILAVILLIVTFFQWLCIGYWVERWRGSAG